MGKVDSPNRLRVSSSCWAAFPTITTRSVSTAQTASQLFLRSLLHRLRNQKLFAIRTLKIEVSIAFCNTASLPDEAEYECSQIIVITDGVRGASFGYETDGWVGERCFDSSKHGDRNVDTSDEADDGGGYDLHFGCCWF